MAVWNSVPNVLTGTTLATTWGTSVQMATDQAGPSRPRCHIARTSGGVIGNSAGTFAASSTINLDTAVHDNDSMFSSFAVHINTAGCWLLTLTAEWINTGTAGLRTIAIWETTGSRYIASESKVGNIGISTYHQLYALELLRPGEVLSPKVAQSSGGNTSFATNNYGLAISCVLVSG